MPEGTPPSPPPPARKSGRTTLHQPKRWHRIAAWFFALGLQALARTLRYRIGEGIEVFDRPLGSPAIYAVWHNRLALCLHFYYRYARPRNPANGLAAIVSASRDGAVLSAVLEALNVQPVRGSSSRRGLQALLELTTWAERGYDLAITPDGPRGPRYVIQEGAVALAQLTGLPIVAAAYELKWKITLKSWDRFQIPLPFSICRVSVTPLFRVPRHASDEEREAIRKQLEAALLKITVD